MSTVTIAVDLAKHVFELAITTHLGTIQERKRLSRGQFEQFWSTRAPLSGSHGGVRELTLLGS